ncbi:MAG: T9SS type A sorting domain-containing protein [Bacteroidia bacterium]
MKRNLLTLSLAIVSSLMLAMSANGQSVQVGTNQFASNFTAPSQNDFGPVRTRGNGPSAARYAFIYPSSLLLGIPNNASISSLEFSRGGSVGGVASSLTPIQGTPNMKIYLRNVTMNDYGPGSINWVSRANAAHLVYDGNPAAFMDSTNGFKRFDLDTAFTYQAGSNIEMLIEYTQSVGQLGDIRWFYNSDGAVPQYLPNSTKTILLDSAAFPNDSTVNSNTRKPAVRFNFPSPINVAARANLGQQFGNLEDEIFPTLIVSNTGLQQAVNITATVNGPGGYISTRQIANLDRDSNIVVVFDSIIPTSPSMGNLTYFVSAPNDGFSGDDTLLVDFIIQDPNATSGVFYNGPFVTNPGAGSNSSDLSVLSPPLSLFGSNVNNGNFAMVEDFILPGTSNYTIDEVGFWGYQTGSTTLPTFLGVYVSIWEGDPNKGATLLFGDQIENILDDLFFSNAYRVSASALTDETRPLMKVTGKFFTPVVLQGGNRYFIEWSLSGQLASGPWQTPITIPNMLVTGNAQQRTSAGYQPFTSGTDFDYPQGAPFEIKYTLNTTSVEEGDGLSARISQIYPNPAADVARLNIELLKAEQLVFEIYDITGKRVVREDAGMQEAGRHLFDLPVAGLQSGNYMVKIISGGTMATRKLQLVK